MKTNTILEVAALLAVAAGTIYIGRTIIKKAKDEVKSDFRGSIRGAVRSSAPITNCYCNGQFVTKVKCHPSSNCCPPCEDGASTSFNGSSSDCDACENKSDARGSGVVQYYKEPVWTV